MLRYVTGGVVGPAGHSLMKFFVPHTPDVQAQEELLHLIRGNVESLVLRTAPQRIYRVAFTHQGRPQAAEVGQLDPVYGDTVFAIFVAANGSEVVVCTPSRGMFNDQPLRLARSTVQALEEFEGG